MLHGRTVHPKTLGSTLISAGKVDKTKYPNSQVIVKGNLVGVVAPTEWEAIQAAMQVADGTKWTDWKGLPPSTKLFDHLRNDADWKSAPVLKSGATKGDVGPALASAQKKLKATYQMSYLKHMPIGPTMAVGDVQTDGMVHIHTHNQNPQELRGQIARMLGTRSTKSSCISIPAPVTTEDRTAATLEPKTRPYCFRKPWASQCACSGCVAMTSNGQPRSPTFHLRCRVGRRR